MSKFLDAALEYAARGWAVFPLAEGQKVTFDTEPDPKDTGKLRAVNVCAL